jgi:hypothetical protein
MPKLTDTSTARAASANQGASQGASQGRRFECPSTRNGRVLLWHPDRPGYSKLVMFLSGFYATTDPDELACLEWLASRGQVVEVPYETSRPTRPVTGQPQPRVPIDLDKDE